MPLDETKESGDFGHLSDHNTIHAAINALPADIGDLATDAEVATAVSDHAAAADPHTGYQKESEKAAASGYASLDGSTKVPIAQLPTGTTSSTVALGDAAAGLITTHEAAGDPHAGYRLESADHTHQSTGAQAGQLDHGAALTGLSDDDHPQYAISFPVTFAKSGELEVTTDTGAARFYLEGNHTISAVQISVGVAPTGAAVIVDVHVDGTTVFTTQSNRPEIAISGFFDASGTIEDDDHDDGQYITVNIDQIGSTLPGENLTVIVWIKRR